MKVFKAEGEKIAQDNKDTRERICRSITICDSLMKSNTRFGRFMDILRHCTIVNKKSSTTSNVWKDLHDHNALFNQFLQSEFPTAYVDITFDLLLNSINQGIFCLKYDETQTLNNEWAPVINEGEEKIRMVRIVNRTHLIVNAKFSQRQF